MKGYIAQKLERLQSWWRAPATRKDRLVGAAVGGMSFFWFGLFGRLSLGATPALLSELVAWVLATVVAGVMLGALFPKPISVIGFPFTFLGMSFGS